MATLAFLSPTYLTNEKEKALIYACESRMMIKKGEKRLGAFEMKTCMGYCLKSKIGGHHNLWKGAGKICRHGEEGKVPALLACRKKNCSCKGNSRGRNGRTKRERKMARNWQKLLI